MIFLTILVFILIFSVLVLVHEWGHFTMARRAGIKVEEFGIGLPPRAKKIYKDKKGTIYSLNWIPFGGYVRLYGEDASDPKILNAKDSYASKTKLQRTAVIVAGVVMNFVLAWFLLTLGFSFGMKPIITEDQLSRVEELGLGEVQELVYITNIYTESSLQEGDLIKTVNAQPVPLAENLGSLILPGQDNQLVVIRGESELELTVPADETGKLGIGIADVKTVIPNTIKLPIHQAAWKSVKEVGRLSYLTVDMLGNVIKTLVQKFTVPEGVAGPVGIFQMTSQFTQQGIIPLMQFTALLSISLGVINIMPFPALDGGRFLFIIFEAILRKKPNAKWEAVIHSVGFILLMLLIVVITWHDILRLFK